MSRRAVLIERARELDDEHPDHPDDDEPDWAAVAEDRRIAAETDARWEGP